MQQDGLIRREADAADKRVQLVYLTKCVSADRSKKP
jgi:DNA-binding MarR family transcriptional regulator